MPVLSSDVIELLAPLSGVSVPLDDVPDEAFRQRLVGDGVAVDPLSDTIVAPCDATIILVHRAKHALTLEAHGLEIVLHLGLDTVKLEGAGLTPLVKAGDLVKAGQPLLRFEPDLVAQRASSLLTPMVIANMDRVSSIEMATGRVEAGRSVLLRVRLKSGVPTRGSDGPMVRSRAIRVADPTGLHARPSATLAAAAKKFGADLRLEKGTREANLRSVVSLMALEVGGGDSVTIAARGADAESAIAALTQLLETAPSGASLVSPAASGAPTSVPTPVPGASSANVSTARAVRGGPFTDGTLVGVAASPGVAMGQVVHLVYDDEVAQERAADPNRERRELDAAIAAAHLQLEALRTRLTAEGQGERATIFAAHQELLEDPELLDLAAAEVRAGWTAAWAWKQAFTAQAERLRVLRDPMLSARATDLRDVGRRLLHLLDGREEGPRALPDDAIVIAEDLTPSDTAALDRAKVRGLCTTMGSATSHVAILARGLGLPAIAGIDIRALDIPEGTRVAVDGDNGTMRVAPTAAEEAAMVTRRARQADRRASALAAAHEPAVTRDAHRVEVAANIGDVRDAAKVVAMGGEGVGLLRSEFVFQDRTTEPTEDEQAALYGEAARALGPERLLVIRTLDVGGDKPLAYIPMEREENPFLGERGIRFTATRPALFRAQVRAVLRASREGKVAIMFPMIATFAEWRAARAVVETERASLGVAPIPIGIMVETAAAAVMAEQFAREADFLSVGTNDLTQYTLAMDRTNPRLAPQVDALHPAVLRLIAMTCEGASTHSRWVGVCGALAGDLIAVPVLIGLGVHELSVDVPLVPTVKARVRELFIAECRATAQLALSCLDGAEVRALVAARHGEAS